MARRRKVGINNEWKGKSRKYPLSTPNIWRHGQQIQIQTQIQTEIQIQKLVPEKIPPFNAEVRFITAVTAGGSVKVLPVV